MRIARNLILLCILLICQQHIVAQSYDLGKQKQSFAYKTLYANQAIDIQPTQPIVVETIDTQSTQEMASAEDIQKCEQVHIQIKKLAKGYPGSHSYKKYSNIYTTLPRTQKNMLILQKIQSVVTLYLRSLGTTFPQIEKQLKNSFSIEEQINIFLSYYKE
jgi:hypothetical protein